MHDTNLQLMSKLREQFMVNDRLREYVERMLNVIIENNPQLLETTMNTDMPVRMAPTPLIITQQTNTVERKDSISTNPSSPVETTTATTTANKSNDKYCRL